MQGFGDLVAHAKSSPPWSDCGPAGPVHAGRVFAWRVGCGALAFTFDRGGARHAITLYDCGLTPAEVVVWGRRFDVIPMGDMVPAIR